MLFDSLDALLGRRSNVRLLRALLPLDRPVSGREAARLAGLSHRVIGSLDDLADLGIIRRREAAGQHLYTFNRAHSLAPAITALFEAERRRASEIFQRLAGIIERSGPAVSAVVFGSAARDEADPGSDLDVLVVVEDPECGEAIHTALVDGSADFESEFGIRVSPVVLTARQARRQREEGDPFIAEVLRDRRRICGKPLDEVLGG